MGSGASKGKTPRPPPAAANAAADAAPAGPQLDSRVPFAQFRDFFTLKVALFSRGFFYLSV